MTCECLYCGRYFSPAESLAKNTPEEFVTTYCCLQHMDQHQEEMSASKAEEFKTLQPEAEASATETKTIEVGGFKLRVRS
jgi:hypothetical protein